MNNDGLGGIGLVGCALTFLLAAAFWGAVYYIVSLIWSHL